MHPSGFNQVIVNISFLFAFDNSAHCLDIVWYKETSPYFFLFIFYFSFLLFSNLWLVDFLLFFSFLLTHTYNPKEKEASFGKILLFFLPRIRLEIFILGQGYGQKVEVWLKRPTDGGTWPMSGYLFSKWFRNKGMPQIISMTRIW